MGGFGGGKEHPAKSFGGIGEGGGILGGGLGGNRVS